MKGHFTKTILALLMLCAGASAWAQNLTVTGVVNDASGEPLPGAAVMVHNYLYVLIHNCRHFENVDFPGSENDIYLGTERVLGVH